VHAQGSTAQCEAQATGVAVASMKGPDVDILVQCMHEADAAFWKGIVVGAVVALVFQLIYSKCFKLESKVEHLKVKVEDKPQVKANQRKAAVLEKMKEKYETDPTREKMKDKYDPQDWSLEKDQVYYSTVYDSKVEELEKSTVSELRSLCKSWRLPIGGLKADLVHRLAEFECERKESISRMLAS
jgi:hypothetical protein